MKKNLLLLCLLLPALLLHAQEDTWIRINQLGYTPGGTKVAVWCSKGNTTIGEFAVVDAATRKTVASYPAGKAFGSYGPFTQTFRLNFSAFRKNGRYYLQAGNAQSPVFSIGEDVYKGTADFCLRYMRQQRSGFNPFLKDSCHTHDGYTLYGPVRDSTHIDVTGGWHDASDYLQYSTTTANATWHLLEAYRSFPQVFTDTKQANGLDGKNGVADVLDEAKWGLEWMLKMNPRPDWMFNQLGDDRDHMGMRIPKEDTFYGRGYERPVYFNSGKPQQRGKFMNATTGTSSTAGKFAAAFALGAQVYAKRDASLSTLLRKKAFDAYQYGLAQPGVAQTASVRSPYIYAEDNWVDDMELGAAVIRQMMQGTTGDAQQYEQQALSFAKQEPVTPWLGADTAKHYQWYPFVNAAHYVLAGQVRGSNRDTLLAYYRQGIERVSAKAMQNAFYRGIPFIWCSNNLTVSFALQCYWYRTLTGSKQYAELEQANIDWIFGCNPWGTSMVYGLPANGDTPVDPHSAFTHLKNYPIDGGLVDGPVYTNIYKGLIGIQLKDADEYEAFQSSLAVYHDDYGDYSTNEPTMDGTASLIYLLASKEAESGKEKSNGLSWSNGAVIRGDSTQHRLALVFTGDEFGDGLTTIANTLENQKVPASFYFTGRFYRNPSFLPGVRQLSASRLQHTMGMHSDMHLLYNDWSRRDSTLVSRDSLLKDLAANRRAMQDAGIPLSRHTRSFIPPYEWWNSEIAGWLTAEGYRVFSFTPGTGSNADYTFPEPGKPYRSTETILGSIKQFNEKRPSKLDGVVLLLHIGTDPRRKDKLYERLNELIAYLRNDGYSFVTMDKLLASE